MTRDVVLGAWACVALMFIGSEVLAVVSDRTAGFRELLQRAVSSNWRIVLAFIGWMWIGWHFFAR